MPEQLSTAAVSDLPLAEVLATVAEALRAVAAGRLTTPPRRQQLGRPGDPDYFRLEMPATWLDAEGRAACSGLKVIEEAGATDAGGARRLGRRSVHLHLTHHASGREAVLEAGELTDRRTGAAAAWAVRWFAPQTQRLAIIGTGRVARATALAAAELLPLRALVATSRSEANRRAFAEALAEQMPCPIELTDSTTAAMLGADAAVAAVPAAEPVFGLGDTAAVRVAVEGDPRAKLIAPEVMAAGPVVTDSLAQAALSGSCLAAGAVAWARLDNRPATLADAAVGRLDELRGQRPVVLLTGLAALDLAVGWRVWQAHGGPPRG